MEGPISSITTRGYFSSSNWPGAIEGEFSINTTSSTTSTLETFDLAYILVSIQRQNDGKYLAKEGEEFHWQKEPKWLPADIGQSNWIFSLPAERLEESAYKVWSCAYDLYGNSQDPLAFSELIFDVSPPVIFPPQVREDTGRKVRVFWDDAQDNLSGIDFYKFSWKKNNDDWHILETYETYVDLTLDWGLKYVFQVQAKDKSGNLSNPQEITYFSKTPEVLISEIQVGDKEFVELYNAEEEDISMKGWYFAYYTSTRDWENPWRAKEFPETAKIRSKGYYLIGLEGYPLPRSDWQPYSTSQLSNISGSVVLYPFNPQGKTKEELKESYIDLVGWGDPLVKEGLSCASPYHEDKEYSLERKPGWPNGHIDSNDNNSDFFLQDEPNPTNSENLSSPSGWLWDWEKRQETEISNQSTYDLSNYQVKVEIEFQEGMDKDFSDIRFTDSDGQTLLSYWREEYSPEEKASFWVKVPFIPKKDKAKIYYYWQNPSAAYKGDAMNTFAWYDDFTTDRLDEYEIIGNRSNLTLDTANSSLRFSSSGQSWLLYPKNLKIKNFILEIKGNADNGQNVNAVWRYQDEDNYYFFGGSGFNSWSYDDEEGRGDGYMWWKKKQKGETVSLMENHESSHAARPYLIRVKSFETLHHVDYLSTYGGGLNEMLSWEISSQDFLESGKIGALIEVGSGCVYLDSIIVRRYTNPEPEVSFGKKQEKIMVSNLSVEDAELWFSPDWSKRAKIIIDNSENRNSLSNYPLMITIPYQEGMAGDFSDLRFTSSDGKTLLSYWFENYNDDKVDVWVNIPHIPCLGRTSIYVYWQNPSATYRGDASSTFTWYDDFNDNSKDKYTIIGDANALTWDTANSRILLERSDREWMLLPKDLSLSDFVIEIKGGFDNTSGIKAIWHFQDENNYYSFGGVGKSYSWSIYQQGEEMPLLKGGSANNIEKIRVAGYQTKYLLDYFDNSGQNHHYEKNSNLLPEAGKIGLWAKVGAGFPWVDYLRIRPFTQPEPKWEFED